MQIAMKKGEDNQSCEKPVLEAERFSNTSSKPPLSTVPVKKTQIRAWTGGQHACPSFTRQSEKTARDMSPLSIIESPKIQPGLHLLVTIYIPGV